MRLSQSMALASAAVAIVGLCSTASDAFTASPTESGAAIGPRHSQVLPFQIEKSATIHKAGAGNRNNPPAAFNPGEAFGMMGWPWVKQHGAGSQPSQQQINQDLQDVLKGMGLSAARLAAADAGVETQAVQKNIISRLDELIKIAEQSQSKGGGQNQDSKERSSMSKQQSQGPGSPPMTPSQSATHSYIPSGSGMSPGDLKAFKSNQHEWGNLPPRARGLILNALRNQPLPQYKTLVEQYYESLAKLNQVK